MSFTENQVSNALAEHRIPVTPESVQRLRDDLEIAAAMFGEPNRPELKMGDAKRLLRALTRTIAVCTRNQLATTQEAVVLRRLRRQALIALHSEHKPGPKPPQWLWPCCLNFLETWTTLTHRPAGLSNRDGPSPALAYLVTCCGLIDPGVTESAIRRARMDYEPMLPNDATDDQVDEAEEAYTAWWREIEEKERDLDA